MSVIAYTPVSVAPQARNWPYYVVKLYNNMSGTAKTPLMLVL